MKTLQEIKEYLLKRKANNEEQIKRNRTTGLSGSLVVKDEVKETWHKARINLLESVLKWLDESDK